MNSNVNISAGQFKVIVAIVTFSTSIITASSGVVAIAKHDAWVSPIINLLLGLFILWIYSYLWSFYPDKTYVEIIQVLLGKWLGTVASSVFIFQSLLSSCIVTHDVSEFISTQYLTKTPEYIIGALLVMSYSIAILYGLESIARSAEIFIYFVLVLFVFAMILVMPKVKVDNLLPVFENGILPIFKGSLLLSGYMNLPLISLMMIYPRVTNTVQAKKSLFSGYVIGTIVVFISNIMSILVLGSNITSKTQYPTYLLAKEINVGIIFSRIEVLIASIWIVGTFFKLLFYFYAGNIGLSQILGQKDYRYMILPMGLIVSVLVTIVYKYAMDSANWAITSWTPFIWSTAFILPVFLLAIAIIKKNLSMNKSS